ncbi:hypothetical protein VQ056_03530 [Paenibacillus sp. JTLBN-2024]
MMEHRYWLINVRLESGYETKDGVVTGTKTEVRHLLMEEGNIAQIVPADRPIEDGLPQIDAGYRLALPSFIEKHCHLDKTLLGGRWRPVTPVKSIFGRLDEEKSFEASRSIAIRDSAANYLEASLRSGPPISGRMWTFFRRSGFPTWKRCSRRCICTRTSCPTKSWRFRSRGCFVQIRKSRCGKPSGKARVMSAASIRRRWTGTWKDRCKRW